MTVYWILFAIPLVGVLLPGVLPKEQSRLVWGVIWLVFTLVIGLRYQVGGDWYNYLPKVAYAAQQTLYQSVTTGAPGYWLLNWLGAHWGGGIYLVNTVCGVIFTTGLMIFARQSERPWLAMLIAVPYLMIVVAMGYSRQSAAIGFEMAALLPLANGRRITFVVLIALGAMFHETAIVLLPLAALGGTGRRIWSFIWVSGTVSVAFLELLLQRFQGLWHNYVQTGMNSHGAAVRIAMDVIPALLLLLFRRRLSEHVGEQRLWIWLSIAAVCSVPMLPVASTAIDRVGLYLIPLQMYVFSRLPRLAGSTLTRTTIVTGVVAYYALVEYVWLNYAFESFAWVPYQFVFSG